MLICSPRHPRGVSVDAIQKQIKKSTPAYRMLKLDKRLQLALADVRDAFSVQVFAGTMLSLRCFAVLALTCRVLSSGHAIHSAETQAVPASVKQYLDAAQHDLPLSEIVTVTVK